MKVLTALLAAVLVNSIVTADEELVQEFEEIIERGLKERLLQFLRNTTKTTLAKIPVVTMESNLACPIPQTWFQTNRTEHTCSGDSECGSEEKCCDWFDNSHCLAGIDMTSRQGECPAPSMFNDACLADHVSCRYDAECPGEDSKCCLNFGCGYKDCQSVRQNLACPDPHSIDTNGTFSTCSKDTECSLDEKCCSGNDRSICVKGTDTTPKRGFCPAPIESIDSSCLTDFEGCNYDSECPGVNDKCCHQQGCSYSKCADMNRDFSCPQLTATPTNDSSSCSPINGTCEGYGLACCVTGVNHSNEHVYSCIQGDIHTPKPGQCPPAHLLVKPCAENVATCTFDSHCWGDHKCCETVCGYGECLQLHTPTTESAPSVSVVERLLGMLTGSS